MSPLLNWSNYSADQREKPGTSTALGREPQYHWVINLRRHDRGRSQVAAFHDDLHNVLNGPANEQYRDTVNTFVTVGKLQARGVKPGKRRGWTADRWCSSEYILIDGDTVFCDDPTRPLFHEGNRCRILGAMDRVAPGGDWYLIQTSKTGFHIVLRVRGLTGLHFTTAKNGYELLLERTKAILEEEMGWTIGSMDDNVFRSTSMTRVPGSINAKDGSQVHLVAFKSNGEASKSVSSYMFDDDYRTPYKDGPAWANNIQAVSHNGAIMWYNVEGIISDMGWDVISRGLHFTIRGSCPVCNSAKQQTAWVDAAGNLHCYSKSCPAHRQGHIKPIDYCANHRNYLHVSADYAGTRLPKYPLVSAPNVSGMKHATFRIEVSSDILTDIEYSYAGSTVIDLMGHRQGIGKSTAVRKILRKLMTEKRFRVALYYADEQGQLHQGRPVAAVIVPTHVLADEVEGKMRRSMPANVKVLRPLGRTSLRSACSRKGQVSNVGRMGLNITQVVCTRCDDFLSCDYFRIRNEVETTEEGAVIIMTTDQWVEWSKRDFVKHVSVAIFDECPTNNLTKVTTITPNMVPLKRQRKEPSLHALSDALRRFLNKQAPRSRKPTARVREWMSTSDLRLQGVDFVKTFENYFELRTFSRIMREVAAMDPTPDLDYLQNSVPAWLIELADLIHSKQHNKIAASRNQLRLIQHMTTSTTRMVGMPRRKRDQGDPQERPIIISVLDANADQNVEDWKLMFPDRDITVKSRTLEPDNHRLTCLHVKTPASRRSLRDPADLRRIAETVTNIVQLGRQRYYHVSDRGTLIVTHKANVEDLRQACTAAGMPTDNLAYDYFNRTQGINDYEGWNLIIVGEAHVNEADVTELWRANYGRRPSSQQVDRDKQNKRIKQLRETLGRCRPLTSANPQLVVLVGRTDPEKTNLLQAASWRGLEDVVEATVSARADALLGTLKSDQVTPQKVQNLLRKTYCEISELQHPLYVLGRRRVIRKTLPLRRLQVLQQIAIERSKKIAWQCPSSPEIQKDNLIATGPSKHHSLQGDEDIGTIMPFLGSSATVTDILRPKQGIRRLKVASSMLAWLRVQGGSLYFGENTLTVNVPDHAKCPYDDMDFWEASEDLLLLVTPGGPSSYVADMFRWWWGDDVDNAYQHAVDEITLWIGDREEARRRAFKLMVHAGLNFIENAPDDCGDFYTRWSSASRKIVRRAAGSAARYLDKHASTHPSTAIKSKT